MTELGRAARDIRNDDRIAEIRLDTMREGSLVRERFSRVKPGMTVAEAMDVGVSKFDIACAVARERVVLAVMKRTDLDLSRYGPRLIAARAGGAASPAAAPEADNDANEIDQTGSITWAHLENPAVARALDEPGRRGGSFPSSAQPAEEAAHFRLEHQLRDFLADHLHLVEIDGKRPRLYQDASGRRGVEYPTPVGRSTFWASTTKVLSSFLS